MLARQFAQILGDCRQERARLDALPDDAAEANQEQYAMKSTDLPYPIKIEVDLDQHPPLGHMSRFLTWLQMEIEVRRAQDVVDYRKAEIEDLRRRDAEERMRAGGGD